MMAMNNACHTLVSPYSLLLARYGAASWEANLIAKLVLVHHMTMI